ncbi:MAG: FAD binding domain-containing protein, partial [Burkholderiales bacterium]
MYEFDYHQPKSLDEAAATLARGGDFKLLAGGLSLIPALKMRLARYSGLVDLGAIARLKGIRLEAGAIVVGA